MNDQREPTAAADLQPTPEASELETQLRRLDRLAELLDDQFELPIIRKRVGLDPIIGLLPGSGDWVTWVAGVYILWMGARLGAPAWALVRMAGHLAVDLLGGYVPVLGDLFDAAYKANRKNVELLFEHFDYHPDERRPGDPPARGGETETTRWRMYLLAALLIVGLGALAAGPIVLVWWLLSG